MVLYYYIVNPENFTLEGSRLGVPASHVCERSVADQSRISPRNISRILPALCLHLLSVTDTLTTRPLSHQSRYKLTR